MSDIPALGKAARALLAKTASTIFNPGGAPKPKAPNLSTLLAGIKPPDFSSKPSNNLPFTFNGTKSSGIPKVNLPDFKTLIPPIKF